MKTVLFAVAVAVACLLLVDESTAAPQKRQNPEGPPEPRPMGRPGPEGPRPMGRPGPDGPRPMGRPGPDGPRPMGRPGPDGPRPMGRPGPDGPRPMGRPGPDGPRPMGRPGPDGPRPMEGPRPDRPRGPKGPDDDINRNDDGRKMEMPPHVFYTYNYAVDENTTLPIRAFVLNDTDMAAVITGGRKTSFAPSAEALIYYDSSNGSTLALIVPFAPYYPCFVFDTTLTHRDIVQTLQARNGTTVSNLPQVSLDGRDDPASSDEVAKLVESNPSIIHVCYRRSIVFTDGISGDMDGDIDGDSDSDSNGDSDSDSDGDDDNTMTEELYFTGLEADYTITILVLEQPNTPEMARPGRSIDLFL